HAVIEVVGPNEITIIDLGSTKGTIVNGKRVNKASLQDGDIILLGDTKIVLSVGDAEDASAEEEKTQVTAAPAPPGAPAPPTPPPRRPRPPPAGPPAADAPGRRGAVAHAAAPGAARLPGRAGSGAGDPAAGRINGLRRGREPRRHGLARDRGRGDAFGLGRRGETPNQPDLRHHPPRT